MENICVMTLAGGRWPRWRDENGTSHLCREKPSLRQEAAGLLHELRTLLGISALTELRLVQRYDVEGLDESAFQRAVRTIFSEPQVDDAFAELAVPGHPHALFAVEPLPGQFDQRADSAAQCIQLMTQGNVPPSARPRYTF